jgi:hypothetical protein
VSPESPFESGNWPPTTADLYQHGRAATLRNYYEYDKQEPIECPICHWAGLAGDVTPEYYRDLFDIPKSMERSSSSSGTKTFGARLTVGP